MLEHHIEKHGGGKPSTAYDLGFDTPKNCRDCREAERLPENVIRFTPRPGA